jgi:hypothetical protein
MIGVGELLVIVFGLVVALAPVGLGVLILLTLRAVRADQAALLQAVQAIQRDLQRTPPGADD